MKSTYTKRVLAFWLAVAMVATGAPAAFAVGPQGTNSSPTSTTTVPASPLKGTSGQSITSVTLKNGDTNISKVIVTGSKVITDGSAEVGKLTATLNDNIPAANVTWSVTVPEGAGGNDVEVAEDGNITVSPKAKAGTYTIKASSKDESITGEASVKLLVERKDENIATAVTVSGGTTTLEIPAGDTIAETTFQATAKDAFDNDLSSKVNWTVSTTPPTLVSIDETSGKLTVKRGAKPETVKVQAKCGNVQSTETSVEIKYANSELQSITEVWMSDTSSDVNVTDGLVLEEGQSATLFVKGLDQYNKEMIVKSDVTVDAKTDSSSNLEFANEKVTAKDQSLKENKTETITVTCNGKVKEVTVTIRPKATDETKVKFATQPAEKNVYGSAIVAPTIKVNDAEPESNAKIRYEYREIADKKVARLADNVLTTMPKDVGKYQVIAYYDSADGTKHGSESAIFEITQKNITVTADNKTITKGDAIPTLTFTVPSGALAYNDSKDVLGVKLTTEATSSSPANTYAITGTASSKNYNVTVTPGTLTIKAEQGIRMAASKSSEDSNRSRYDLSVRRGTGYIDLNADADDYLNRQTVDDEKDYWIGFDVDVYLDGNSTSVNDLYVLSTGKSNSWEKIGSLSNSKRYIGDFYLDNLGSDNSFTLWFNTDDDSDNSDRLYFATNSSGANEYYIDVDFDAYSGSSSSSSGSSSSNTSKKDGDRVSTTTIDKTPSVKSGSATVTFSSSALSDALADNKKEAKREDADKTYIELDVKTSKSVDDTTITVPRKSLDNLADEDTGLQLTTNHGTFTFDYRALAEIYDACDKTNIEFYIEEEDDDQYVLLIKDGSSDVIDLGKGEVEVTFDYKLKSGEKSSDVKVYRIGNGDKTWLATYGGSTVYGASDLYAAAPTYVTDMKADYSSSKKKVTFTTDALGTFLVTTDTLKTGSSSSGSTTTPTYSTFIDVPNSRWSATYINKLAALGIINGTGGGYFEPTLYVTREEFVKMLAGVAGANVDGYTSSRFPDVSLSRWSAPYIAWAADRGITTGTDGGNFAPTMRITREEMATMIYRYVQSAGKTLPAKNAPVIFADANLIDGWAQTPVSIMQQAGIIDGNVNNGRYTFDPLVPASREECAKMLSILYDLIH